MFAFFKACHTIGYALGDSLLKAPYAAAGAMGKPETREIGTSGKYENKRSNVAGYIVGALAALTIATTVGGALVGLAANLPYAFAGYGTTIPSVIFSWSVATAMLGTAVCGLKGIFDAAEKHSQFWSKTKRLLLPGGNKNKAAGPDTGASPANTQPPPLPAQALTGAAPAQSFNTVSARPAADASVAGAAPAATTNKPTPQQRLEQSPFVKKFYPHLLKK